MSKMADLARYGLFGQFGVVSFEWSYAQITLLLSLTDKDFELSKEDKQSINPKPKTFNMQNEDIIIKDMRICTGYVEMVIPAGGSHVRQVEVRLPIFIGTPVVTANVTSPDSNGSMFSLWNVKINHLAGQTQIMFSAANVQIGVPSNFTYFVSYVVTGKII